VVAVAVAVVAAEVPLEARNDGQTHFQNLESLVNLVARFFAIAIVIFFPTLVLAHLMPAGQGTINVIGNLAYVAISIPQKALQDGEPQATKDENQGKEKRNLKKSLIELFKMNISLESQGVRAPWKEVFVSVPESSVEAHAHHRHEEIIFTAIAAFRDAPQEIRLLSKLRLPPKCPIEVMAAISEKGKIVVKERQQLSEDKPQLEFFKKPTGVLKALYEKALDFLNTARSPRTSKPTDKAVL